jgi:PAS domain S-box-containing protein
MIGILVVEDERIVAMALEKALRCMRYSVVGITDSGEDAIRKAVQTQPDLVLMDIRLRGPMDGIDAAAQIQSQLDVPVVYLTAYADDETLQQAKVTEPYGYVLKPFEERDLRIAIEIALFRHASERQLRERKQWLDATLNTIHEALITVNAREQVMLMNPAAQALTGWRGDEAWGKPVEQVLRIEDRSGKRVLAKAIREANRGVRTVALTDHMVIRQDGTRVPADCSVASIYDPKGKLAGSVIVSQDVTARIQADQALQASEERYRSLFDSAVEGVLLMRPDGTILDCNDPMSRLIGLQKADIVGHSFADLSTLAPEVGRLHMDWFARLSNGQQVPPFTMSLGCDGEERAVIEIVPAALRSGGQVYALQIIARRTQP